MFCAGCCGVSTLGATEVCWWVSFSFFSGGAIDALSARAVVATQGRARRSRKSNLTTLGLLLEQCRTPPSSRVLQASKQSVPYALRHSCGSNPRKTHKPRPRMQSNFEYEFTHHMGGTKTGRTPLCLLAQDGPCTRPLCDSCHSRLSSRPTTGRPTTHRAP